MTNISKIASVVHTINNPNLPITTVIEEIPSDIGRTRAGFKRGGVIEGMEKLRREVMAAVVWILGIPAFKKAGEVICEKLLKIPMDIDFSQAAKGNDAIGDSVRFITSGVNEVTEQTKGLKKYLTDAFQKQDPQKMIKNITKAKKITIIGAFILNCAMMGIVLPKINQAITRKKLKEMDRKTSLLKNGSIDEFKKKTKREPSFTGLDFVYNMENNNIFRLVSTDIPMIAGRMATSRNKYEAIENAVLDGGSSYFYNFALLNTQAILRFLSKTPEIQPKISETIIAYPDKLKTALENLSNTELMKQIADNKGTKNAQKALVDLFQDESLAKEIYESATYGKFGKVNRFVRYEDIDGINNCVIKFLNKINSKEDLFDKNNNLLMEKIKSYTKSMNMKNTLFLGLGLGVSIFGLAILMPKLSFALTKKLTGKDQFTGIAHYDDDKKKSVNNC